MANRNFNAVPQKNTIVANDRVVLVDSEDSNKLKQVPATTFVGPQGPTGPQGPAGASGGDVVGPASSTDNDIAVFDLTTGKLIKDGGATIAQVRDRSTHTGTQSASTITTTTQNVGNSTNLDTFLANIDESATSMTQTGFFSWNGSGNYYSVLASGLTLLRGGTGFIKGKKITWAGGQTTAALTNHSAHWVYIDGNGTIGITTNRTTSLYDNNIILFEIHYNAVDIEVVIENHSYTHNTAINELLHEQFGTVFTPVDGTNVIGADITRVATGTGGAIGDRQLKIVGDAVINDQGLTTLVSDSGGSAITYKFYYKNNVGQWTEYASQTQFPMVYNNAGTITSLATSGATDTGLFTLYAIKAEPNSGLPIYIAVINNSVFATDAAALAALSAGTIEISDGTLFQALEPAQLGHVIVTNNVSGGYISTVNIAKATARSGISGGAGATTASGVSTVTTNFNGILSSSDTNVQVALETIDDHAHSALYPTKALDNLASVAINTSLVSDTDNTDDLGTTIKKWANLFVTTIGATATRVTKGWFTDIESTNMPTVGGTSIATTFAGGNATQNIGYLNIPQNSQSAAYTTVLADAGKHIYHPSADTTARTFTIDSNANVAYPIGTAITFVNDTSGGVITIAITTDTLVLAGAGTTGSRTLAANGVATAIKMTSTRWMISGTGLT